MTTADKYLDWDTALLGLIKVLESNNIILKKVCGNQDIIILRDWRGRIHLGLPGDEEGFKSEALVKLLVRVNSLLGPLSAASTETSHAANEVGNQAQIVRNLVFFREALFDPSDFWDSPHLVKLESPSKLLISLLDRQDKENDWLRKATESDSDSIVPRAVFFGVKGGVGRSSALTALALHLAGQGKRVLVIDADFESPGVSSSLLDAKIRPDFGLVDWLTAHALGFDGLEELAQKKVVETSPLSERAQGKILIAPSHGILTQTYVGKLGRMYRTTEDGMGFAERLRAVVSLLERLHQADVTLIDSRAGIDDTAAAAITQLNARVSFLFAINTQQTWDAYSLLFKHLKRHPSIHTEDDFRYRLRFVSALTPEEVGSTKGYWANLREMAYSTCAENLYDKDNETSTEADESNHLTPVDYQLLNPAFDDEDVPHYPMRIMWDEVLRAFDPVQEPGQLAPTIIAKSFGDFLTRATRLLG